MPKTFCFFFNYCNLYSDCANVFKGFFFQQFSFSILVNSWIKLIKRYGRNNSFNSFRCCYCKAVLSLSVDGFVTIWTALMNMNWKSDVRNCCSSLCNLWHLNQVCCARLFLGISTSECKKTWYSNWILFRGFLRRFLKKKKFGWQISLYLALKF